MEESEVEEQKETVNNKCRGGSNENNSNEATGDVSSHVSNPESAHKTPVDTEARYERLKLFEKVMQKSLEKFLEHASFNRFASMFRPLYKKNPQKMESIHKEFIDELRRAIQEDIGRLIEEGRLELKLNELDKLEKAAKNTPDPAWRPSGVPEQDFCSFVMPFYQKQEAYMKLELKKIKQENAALAKKVQAGREKIAQTENCISMTVDEWKATLAEYERPASFLFPAGVFDV